MTVLEDKDLRSVQQARTLVERAAVAEQSLKNYSQQQVDAIVGAMAAVAQENAHPLAALAVDETGRGRVEDKTAKNRFAAVDVYRYLKNLKTCGVIGEDRQNRVIEIGVPFGVIAVIIPTTNPTSTTIFKVLSSIKGRNTVVISPHPQAVQCTVETARLMYEAALKAGAPEGCINCMDVVTLEGTHELMRHKKTQLILATGGMDLVRAAYSSGKPAYGVGPGNVPAFIERTADVPKAVRDILTGKTFDNGLLCSSEQAMICDRSVFEEALRELKANHAHLLSHEEQSLVERLIQLPNQRLNPAIVGKSARFIARMAGFQVSSETTCLVGRPGGVGLEHPLSMEKLSPILALYEVDGWQEGCQKCIEILEFGGMGHTMTIHSKDQRVILEFGLQKPAHRIAVNTPATHGSVGLTTGLAPSMTLGCGGPGGNITSDNITARHLINVRRLAFEIRATEPGRSEASTETPEPAATDVARSEDPAPDRIAGAEASDQVRQVVRSVVEDYLEQSRASADEERVPFIKTSQADRPSEDQRQAVDFVCEDDVQQALEKQAKIVVNSQTIITPSARDRGKDSEVFIWE